MQEVEDLIGAPPGWYDGVLGIREGIDEGPAFDYKTWIGKNGEILVEVDENQRVVIARYARVTIIDHSTARMVWERLSRGYLEWRPPWN